MRQNFTASSLRLDLWVIIAFAALVAVSFYLIVSARVFSLGFPLDDAWIHLTYARNLVQHGEWAFRLGERSAGSTSPLWTALLSLGFLFNLGPYAWTYFLGWLVLTSLAICGESLARLLAPSYRSRFPWVGLFFVFAWHLTWSALSGMETLLHSLLILVVLGALMCGSRRYLALGLLTGLSVWVRPDGLTLLGPLLFVILLSEKTWHLRAEGIWKALIGFGSLFLPYVLFNLALSGNPMPNTYYAKQAEYATLLASRSLTERIADYLFPVLATPFLVLIPGACLWLVGKIRAHNWGALASLIWAVGYIGLYFLSLPAYQHGRYIIPAFPVMYMWGLLGFFEFVAAFKGNRAVVQVWQMVIIILSLAFTWIGARQNANDIFWIESEMVATAKWVSQNIPADARLAVHDIGALGYYVPNPIIDMAGLATPDVVPFIRDEARLAQYLDRNAVDYLITFPSFYPQLTAQREPIFKSGLPSGTAPLGENMQVYRWE